MRSEVLVLRRAAQPVVSQPQVLQVRRRLSAQALQISHSVAAELQDLPGTEGTTNTLSNELFLALPQAVFTDGTSLPIPLSQGHPPSVSEAGWLR